MSCPNAEFTFEQHSARGIEHLLVGRPAIGAAIYDRVCGITPAFCGRVHLNRIALADVCFFELRKMRLNAHISFGL
jgi:hypothetical protein